MTLALGVQLVGEGGGEWVLDLRGGDVRVRPGSRAETAFSYVQTVEDWRGALWEGRGGAVGRGAAALFRPGAPEVEAADRARRRGNSRRDRGARARCAGCCTSS